MRAILTAALLLAAGCSAAPAEREPLGLSAHPPFLQNADQPADQPRQRTCLPPDALAKKLAALHETLTATGIASDGTLLMIFRSKDGATWTIAKVTAKPRMACVVDMGTELSIKQGGEGI